MDLDSTKTNTMYFEWGDPKYLIVMDFLVSLWRLDLCKEYVVKPDKKFFADGGRGDEVTVRFELRC